MIVLLFPAALLGKSVDSLLAEMALDEDLSAQTVKENDGYVIVFKRQDLERMKIHSFMELMERIPYLRYNENSDGLSSPFYAPYQPALSQFLRVYINDRELLAPFNGNGLQVFAQMDMAHIDHVEIYMGLTSYTISREGTFLTIKLYTKTGSRENTSVLGLMGGSNATGEAYVSKGGVDQDYDYFAYADVRQYGRNRLYHEGYPLSREKTSGKFYGQIVMPKWRFETQASIVQGDTFMGNSWQITPDETNAEMRNLYAGAFYEEGALKASVNYANTLSTYIDRSTASALGVRPVPTPPYYVPYFDYRQKLDEHLVDAWVHDRWQMGRFAIMAGVQQRFKQFRFETLQFDGVSAAIPSNYDRELISSVFGELTYLLNASNLFTLSGNLDYFNENGGVRDRTLPLVRIGYLLNHDTWVFKLYGFYAQIQPQPSVLFENDAVSLGTNELDPQTSYAFSSQLRYEKARWMAELLVGHTVAERQIIYDLQGYRNSEDRFAISTIQLRTRVPLGAEDKFELDGWAALQDFGPSAAERYSNTFGAQAVLYKRFGKVDTYNMLSCRSGYHDVPVGWNYHVTLSYDVTRNLQLYLKGENPFGTALKTNYFRIDPLHQAVTTLERVEVYERTLMAGLELQF
jgi:vitamin B12 transporter